MNRTNRGMVALRLSCAGLALWFALLSCNLPKTTSVGDLINSTQTVDLGNTSAASVEIEFPGGELKVDGEAVSLMDAAFRYNVANWGPQVEYTVNGSQGELLVLTSGEDLPVGDKVIYQWDIHLNDSLPLNVVIRTGAGMSDLNLSNLDLTALRLEVGAGETNLDLGGDWDHDVTAAITGGVGELSIQLPENLGVRVNMDTGLVSVTTKGLTKDGQGFVNQSYGTAPHTLTLDISAGVGAITLVAR